MKHVKKLASFALALVMALSMCVTAFAAGDEYKITVKNSRDNISMEGQTYTAYKLFDVKYNDAKTSFSYTIAPAFAELEYEGAKGQALVEKLEAIKNDASKVEAFAETALKYIKDKSITSTLTATGTQAQGSVDINVDTAGYYLITGTAKAKEDQTVTAACALTTTKPTAEVIVKADAPTVDKKIVENGNKTDKNNAAIGDKVDFEVTSKVPNMEGYEKYFFVVNDTLSEGLTFDNATEVVVKVGNDTLTKVDANATEGANGNKKVFSVEQDGQNIKIVLKNFIQYKDKADLPITITYSAIVNKNAETGEDPNTNTVNLTYSNNPNEDSNGKPENPDEPDGKDPTGTTPNSETETYVTELTIIKTDETGQALRGAKFEITGEDLNTIKVTKAAAFVEDENGTHWKLNDGTYTTTSPETEGIDKTKYDDLTKKYKVDNTEEATIEKADNVKYEVEVGEDGKVTLTGLKAGEYTIKETQAPEGYNKIADKNVTISWDKDQNPKWSYSGTTRGNELEIVNQKGNELPSTGGMGTTILYTVGGLMVIGAGVLLITKKRMGAR